MTTDPEFRERVLNTLNRLERWMETHDQKHVTDEADRNREAVKAEGRITKVESAMQTRTWIGVVFTTVAGALGILIKPPNQ